MAEGEIELNKNSYISVNGYTTSLEGFKLKKNKEEIKDEENLTKYFMDIFSTFKFNNIEDSKDTYNNKSLDEVFNFKEKFKDKNLFIININDLFNKIKPDNKENIKAILDNVFTKGELCLIFKTFQKVLIEPDLPYKLKKEFKNKLEEVNNEIKSYFNIRQIKDLMANKGFTKDKISINDNGIELEDNFVYKYNNYYVNYNDDIDNYLEPATAEIEFIPGNGLVTDKNAKNYKIDFLKDNINNNTKIFDFITNKFKGLSDKNCKIEYFNSEDNTWNDVDEGDGFYDEDKIRITINAEVKGFTIKKNPQKPPKNKDQQNQDESDSGSGNKKEQGCCGKCSGGDKNK